MTSRQGVETYFYYDDLGRVYQTVAAFGTVGKITSVSKFDGLGRVTDRGVDGDTDGDIERADDDDHVSSMTYDVAGRVVSTTDPEGRKTFTTYRRVKSDGSAFTVGTDTGAFYWETRRYGDNDDVPVSVSWADSHGRVAMSFTASCTWAGAAPTGAEALTEHSRRTSVYDWADRVTESRSYFDLSGLSISLSSPGVLGTNYLVTGKTEYDALGRGFRRTDAAGNITETQYEPGTGRVSKVKAGVAVGSLEVVSRQFYKLFEGGDDANNPTGDDRPWVTRSYSVKPGLTSAPTENAAMSDYVYVETYESFDVAANALTSTHRGAQPQHGPWSKSTSNALGQTTFQRTYPNGSTTYLLAETEFSYITTTTPAAGETSTNNGQLQYTYTREVDGSGAVTGDHIRTHHQYDDAGRRVKTSTDGRGFTKMAYDVYGRNERTVFGSDEGTNTDVYGTDAFTDDIILTESVPTYDKSGLVLYTTSYSRNHDTPGTTTGLLSAAASSASRVGYSATWYDDHGRPTHTATYGTNGFAAFSRPATAPEPDTSDSYLVNKIEYDDAGRAYLATDNTATQTRTFFDDMGRPEYVVENWSNNLTTPATPGSRDADVNRVTQTVYDNSATGGGVRTQLVAIDPDADGVYTDNQTTHYIHSGEINTAQRGPIPVNARPVAVLMPDAVEDGTSRANAIASVNAGGGGDFTLTEYYADGALYRTTDQRGVQWTFHYTDQGWLEHRRVTANGTWTAVGDLRLAYTYGDRGEILTATAYDDATGGAANQTSQVTYTYDGYYNQITEAQDHDPTANGGAGDPKTLTRHFDNTTSNNVFTHAYRPTGVTYPNGREVDLTYGTSGDINDHIGRVEGLDDTTPGSVLGNYQITRYTYLGSGAMVRKDYTVPDVRLDFVDETGEGSSATDPYDASFDRFGRALRYQWETYDTNGDADQTRIQLTHHYDRASNRLHDQRAVYTGHSKTFNHDELDRIDATERGVIEDNAGTMESVWTRRTQDWDLDALGNPLEIDRDTRSPYTQNIETSDSNELESREVYEIAKSSEVFDGFDSSATANQWEAVGSDTFVITNGQLNVTAASADSIDGQTESTTHALFLWGPEVGMFSNRTPFSFDSGLTSTARAGLVFGYQDPHNYWLAVVKYVPGGTSLYEICEVANGTLTVHATQNTTVTPGGYSEAHVGCTQAKVFISGLAHEFTNGFPAGRIGIYTDTDKVKFHSMSVWPHDEPSDLAGRWDRHSSTYSSTNGIKVTNTDIRRHYPTFLRGATHPADQPWRATVMFSRTTNARNHDDFYFLFNARDHDTYSAVRLHHATTADAGPGREYFDGDTELLTGTENDANVPTATAYDDHIVGPHRLRPIHLHHHRQTDPRQHRTALRSRLVRHRRRLRLHPIQHDRRHHRPPRQPRQRLHRARQARNRPRRRRHLDHRIRRRHQRLVHLPSHHPRTRPRRQPHLRRREGLHLRRPEPPHHRRQRLPRRHHQPDPDRLAPRRLHLRPAQPPHHRIHLPRRRPR
ncbi:MAG: hypothetical protein AAGH88_15405 [Planctomycetota bacterium]